MTRDEIRDAIKTRIPCTDYLQKSKGNLFNCPYCGSGTGQHATGAVKYYSNSNSFTCHACGKTGDIIDLLQQTQHTDYNGALAYGAQLLGLDITRSESHTAAAAPAKDNLPSDGAKAPKNAPQRATEPPADYTAYYKECCERLPNSPEAIAYLNGRGISLETAQACGIGFDPTSDPATAPGAAQTAKKYHPAPRLIMPTTPQHYVARAISAGIDKAYSKMNPKGAKPGIFNAQAIQPSEDIYVVEGIIDALSIIECGMPAIALSSAGNGKLLIDYLLQRPAAGARFIIAFDADHDPKTAERTAAHAKALCRELEELEYTAIVYDIRPLCGDQAKDINELLQLENGRNIILNGLFVGAAMQLNDYVPQDQLQAFADKIQTEAYKPIPTGLTFFDRLMSGGITAQTLTCVLAAPAAGKTALCQQIAEAMAEHGRPVEYLNLEMSREQMLARALSLRLAKRRTYRSAQDILQGYNWSEADKEMISAELAAYRREAFPCIRYNPDGVGTDIDDISRHLSFIGDMANENDRPAPVIILDYLHLVTSSAKEDAAETMKRATKALKDYAIAYNTLAIAIVAVNRASMKDGRIAMYAGRDTSAIEYTADYMVTLNYSDIDSGNASMDSAEDMERLNNKDYRNMILRVEKNRHGQAGRSEQVYFRAANNLFVGMNTGGFFPAMDGSRVPFPTIQGKPQVI